MNTYCQVDTLYNTEKGTNEFTHVVFQNNEDSATIICDSYDFDFTDSAFYSHLVLYRLSLKSGALRELARIHKNLWQIYSTYHVPFEPDSNKIMYLISDTAERNNGKYRQQFYQVLSTTNDWQSIENQRLNLPFQKYFIGSCLKGNTEYVFTGDTTNIVGSASFFARVSKSNICKTLKVYPFSFSVGSIIKINENYLLSGVLYENSYGTRFHMLVDSTGEEVWRKVYKDSLFDFSGFYGLGVSIGNRIYHSGFKYIYSKLKYIGVLNCIDENGQFIFEKDYEIGEKLFIKKIIFRDGSIYVASMIDTLEIDGQTTTYRVLLLKINPVDGKILWYQNYHHGKQDIEIHNLYNTKQGFLLCGTGIDPKRLPEFDSTHFYEYDGWLLMVDTNGCIVPGCKPILIGGTQHILHDESIISIYPNPVGEIIHIQINNTQLLEQNCFIGIYDINGVELYSQYLKSMPEKIQIPRPANHHGFAILAMKTSQGTFYKRLMFK